MTSHSKVKKTAAAKKQAQKTPSFVDRREGALDCMESLRLLLCDAAVPCGHAAVDYFTKQYADANAFVERLGPMPARIEGILIALAEFIHVNQTTGEPSVEESNSWLPWVAKTEEERTADVAWMQECYDEDEAAAKVIQFPVHSKVPRSERRAEPCPA